MQLIGVLALVMILSEVGAGSVFAVDEGTTEVGTVEVQQSETRGDSEAAVNEVVLTTTAEQGVVRNDGELATAIRQAEAALDYAKNNPSATYPGIDKYIDKLLATARSEGVDKAKIIESLKDATSLTYKLLSKNQTVSNFEAVGGAGLELASETKTENAEIPTKVVAGVVDPGLLQDAMNNNANNSRPGVVSPVVSENNTGVDDADAIEPVEDQDDKKVDDGKTETKPESNVDIVEHEMGMVEILIAGAVVLVLGGGITALMIRSRRNA